MRSSFARLVFQTDAVTLRVKALQDTLSFSGGYNSVGVIVDSVPTGFVALGAQGEPGEGVFLLAAGTKTVELVDGPTGYNAPNTPPVRGTPVLWFGVDSFAFVEFVAPTQPAIRVVSFGDSNTQGAFTSSGGAPLQCSPFQAWTMLQREQMRTSVGLPLSGAAMTVAGYGGMRWNDIASSAAALNQFIGRMVLEADGVDNIWTTNAGVNDYSSGASAATVQAQVTSVLAALQATGKFSKAVCIGPTFKVNGGNPNAGGSTLAQVSAGIAAACAGFPGFAFYTDGFPFVTYPTNYNADLLHYNTTGMAEYATNNRTFFGTIGLGY